MSRTRSSTADPIISPFGGAKIAARRNGIWYSATTLLTPGNWISQDTKTMTDDVRVGYFKALREKKLLPIGPMSSTKVEYTSTPGSTLGLAAYKNSTMRDGYSFDSSGDWGFSYRNNRLNTIVTQPNKAVLLQEALSRAQSDAWDTLTFAAEFRKTVEGVVTLRQRAMTIAERVETIVKHRRNSRKWKGYALSDVVAQVWLELRYMWRPLVYDMIAMEEAYRRLGEERTGSLQRAYASDTKSGTSSNVVTSGWKGPNDVGGGGAFVANILRIETVTVTGHAAVGVTIDTRAITMTDPLVTAWELVPFSFILDWFITFGSMLSAFSPFASSRLEYATYALTTTREMRVTVMPVNVASFPFMEGTANPSITIKRETSYVRTLEAITPTLAADINLDVSKVFDLVAIWSVINRKTIMRILR